MDKRRWNQRKATKASCSEGLEVTSVEWKVVVMSEQEDDLIFRMYKLVGDRWSLIAGRIPGRTPEVIERYWLMKHSLILFSQIDEEDNFVSLYFPRLRLRKKNNNILV